MYSALHDDEAVGSGAVSTGRLPDAALVRSLVLEAEARYRGLSDGTVADYNPKPRPTSATRASPGCCMAMAACTATRTRRPTSTRANVR